MVLGPFTYVCVAGEEMGRGIPFAFLEEVKSRFTVSGCDEREGEELSATPPYVCP